MRFDGVWPQFYERFARALTQSLLDPAVFDSELGALRCLHVADNYPADGALGNFCFGPEDLRAKLQVTTELRGELVAQILYTGHSFPEAQELFGNLARDFYNDSMLGYSLCAYISRHAECLSACRPVGAAEPLYRLLIFYYWLNLFVAGFGDITKRIQGALASLALRDDDCWSLLKSCRNDPRFGLHFALPISRLPSDSLPETRDMIVSEINKLVESVEVCRDSEGFSS